MQKTSSTGRATVWPWRTLCIGAAMLLVTATSVSGSDAASEFSLEPPLAAAQPAQGDQQLSSMSLEDLMNIEVTSVSKTRQRISEAPAAVTVISPDDIARSGLN